MPFFSDLRRVSSFAAILKKDPTGFSKPLVPFFLFPCGPGPCSLCLIFISGPLTGPRSLSRGIFLWIVHAPPHGLERMSCQQAFDLYLSIAHVVPIGPISHDDFCFFFPYSYFYIYY